jgi:hypothetical protein
MPLMLIASLHTNTWPLVLSNYWRLGRRGPHLMAASFSNFPEDPTVERK